MKPLLTTLLGCTHLSTAFALPPAATGPGGAPTALDDAYSTTTGDNLSVDAPGVLANDTDPEGDPLEAFLVDSTGAAGVLKLFKDGSLEYEVAPGFVGTDTFTYVANDGTQDSAPATITFTVTPGGGVGSVEFTDPAAFLAAIEGQGWTAVQESFEDPVWPRTPATAPSVSNLGITWTGNNPTSEVTTGPGPALFGQYGFFELPHGSYTTGTDCHLPGSCTDGWIATADTGTFVAAGIWIHCNAGTAGIEFFLDGDTANPVEFGGFALPAGSTGFYGVIDSGGFRTFEVHETEGKDEDASYIFGDLFTFAFAAEPEVLPYGCGVNPVGSLAVSSGAPQIGTTLVLAVDNPLGTQASGSLPFLGLALAPAPGFPCGPVLPGFGMAFSGAPGEILLSVTPPNPLLTVAGEPWTGSPAPVALAIPANPALAGMEVFTQAALVDLAPGAGVPVGLTDALELRIGL